MLPRVIAVGHFDRSFLLPHRLLLECHVALISKEIWRAPQSASAMHFCYESALHKLSARGWNSDHEQRNAATHLFYTHYFSAEDGVNHKLQLWPHVFNRLPQRATLVYGGLCWTTAITSRGCTWTRATKCFGLKSFCCNGRREYLILHHCKRFSNLFRYCSPRRWEFSAIYTSLCFEGRVWILKEH